MTFSIDSALQRQLDPSPHPPIWAPSLNLHTLFVVFPQNITNSPTKISKNRSQESKFLPAQLQPLFRTVSRPVSMPAAGSSPPTPPRWGRSCGLRSPTSCGDAIFDGWNFSSLYYSVYFQKLWMKTPHYFVTCLKIWSTTFWGTTIDEARWRPDWCREKCPMSCAPDINHYELWPIWSSTENPC